MKQFSEGNDMEEIFCARKSERIRLSLNSTPILHYIIIEV